MNRLYSEGRVVCTQYDELQSETSRYKYKKVYSTSMSRQSVDRNLSSGCPIQSILDYVTDSTSG